jgi:2-haloacid dehalogenase
MTGIRHIVFDIGNVLLNWDPELPYRRLIPDPAERARFLAEVCSPAWNAEQDRGRSWQEAEEALIATHPGDAAMIRAYRTHWPEMIPGHIEESVGVLEALIDGGRDVTGLTNFAADTFDVARRQYPFLDRLRGVTVSARIGLVKPDAAIYRHHAEAFGLDPAATLFFDDNAANVEGARAAGWNAERFESPEGLRSDLERHGIRLA